MVELYKKLFDYGIDMTVMPQLRTHAYIIEFAREGNRLRFFITNDFLGSEWLKDTIQSSLDTFIFTYDFKPVPQRHEIWREPPQTEGDWDIT